MKHIVFIVGAYYPNFSAVGYCAYQVQRCLAREYKVSVISYRNDISLPLEQTFEGHQIYRLETASMSLRNRLTNTTGNLAKLGLLAVRGYEAARRLLSPVTADRGLIRAFTEQLDALESRPDVIVPFVFPIESALAAMEYCKVNRRVKYYPYVFDNFVDSDSLHVLGVAKRIKRNRHLRLEHKMLQKSDGVLSMHPLRDHFEKSFDKYVLEKTVFLEHPLLVKPAPSERAVDKKILRMCYTGSLVKKVREPDYLLDLLRAIKTPLPLRADFFVMGNAAHRIKTEEAIGSIRIINHGQVPKHVADAAVSDADILLNIGEVRGKQISSKIFEYLSSGKPIIHLAAVDDDVNTRILDKYPLAICLVNKPGKFEENLYRINKFLSNVKFETLSFAEVASIFPEALPTTNANLIANLIENNRISPANDSR